MILRPNKGIAHREQSPHWKAVSHVPVHSRQTKMCLSNAVLVLACEPAAVPFGKPCPSFLITVSSLRCVRGSFAGDHEEFIFWVATRCSSETAKVEELHASNQQELGGKLSLIYCSTLKMVAVCSPKSQAVSDLNSFTTQKSLRFLLD
jgi:hypothetical protein